MDIGNEKERFVSIQIKSSVAKKFSKFSKESSKSQSMTLLLMMEFFEHNGIAPTENFSPKMQTLKNLIKDRFSVVIAILKNIEKTQTKPTAGMLMALLEQAESYNPPPILENNNFRADKESPLGES